MLYHKDNGACHGTQRQYMLLHQKPSYVMHKFLLEPDKASYCIKLGHSIVIYHSLVSHYQVRLSLAFCCCLGGHTRIVFRIKVSASRMSTEKNLCHSLQFYEQSGMSGMSILLTTSVYPSVTSLPKVVSFTQ